MNKVYSRINWENYPSAATPLNEDNLNKVDVATDEIDNRVITLDTTKFDKSEAQTLIKSVSLDEATGIFTFTYYSGATFTIDTMLEKIIINFDFDYKTQKLIFTLDDGTIKYVDLSALITQYEFDDTDTIAFLVDSSGHVSSIVKEGSIEEKHLQPNYLADAFFRANNGNAFIMAATGKDGVGMQFVSGAFCPVVASAFAVSSSKRYKENIVKMSSEKAKLILEVEVVDYDYIDGIVPEENQTNRTGVIAEDIEEIIPEVVSYKKIDGESVPDGVDYSKFVPYLIKMIQLQQEEIDELKILQ